MFWNIFSCGGTKMTFSSLKIYLGELNHTALGDLRLAASDLGLIAVEWADSQLELYSYLFRLKHPVESNQKMIASISNENVKSSLCHSIR
jgi:hypothetical protein